MIDLSRLLPDPIGLNWIGKWLRENTANPRSRLLLLGLAVAVAAAGLTLLDSLDGTIAGRIKERQQQLARFENVGDAAVWHRRRTETDLARVQAEARLWEAETAG